MLGFGWRRDGETLKRARNVSRYRNVASSRLVIPVESEAEIG